MRWLALAALVALPASARAASCYDESSLPAVVNLEAYKGVLRAYLGGRLYDGEHGLFPTLALVEGEGWRFDGVSRCKWGACGYLPEARHQLELCAARIPPIALSAREAKKLNPELPAGGKLVQRVGACVEVEGVLWFGIAFEEGRGIGGVGRFDPAKKKLEIRRPALLRDAAVTSIAHDGARLWLGTESIRGCIGTTPAEGLVSYDWRRDEAKSFRGTDGGPCGFLIHALSWRNGGLWAATDLGLSRWDASSGAWEHLVAESGPEQPAVRKVSCEALYLQLLSAASTAPGATLGYGSARDQLVHALRAFRPAFAARHLAEEAE